MKIYQVTDLEFAEFGRVVEGYDLKPMLDALKNKTPMPERGTNYVPEEPELQKLPAAQEIAPTLFGGLDVQFGWCNGYNAKLNCLEYHRNSEFNLGTEDFVLLLARQSDLDDKFHMDTARVMAFQVPAGVLVEIYATSLHYAPCHTDPKKGFRVLVALPKGTNNGRTQVSGKTREDRLLWAKNKWLIAHPEATEAEIGAFVGLDGKNPSICEVESENC